MIDARPAADRLPPGQVLTTKWPVLHYSDVQHVVPEQWRLSVTGLVENPISLSWAEFSAMPQEEVLCDIHCVTRWSRLDNRFSGVPVQRILELARPRPAARFVMVHAEPRYTTNLPLADLDRPENLLATHHDGMPLTVEHGGPVRLLVPHLYLWKSAKWVTGFEFLAEDEPGLWEENGYHMLGDPWREQRYGRPDPARMRRGPTR